MNLSALSVLVVKKNLQKKGIRTMNQNKVLIVDDNPQNIQVLGTVLKEAKYQVGFATNGKQAIEILHQSNDFDIVLLDIDMPILDGYQTCSMIRNTEKLKDIPVIFLTAFVEEENIVRGFDSGAQDYVLKPFNARELLARVDTHIQLKNKSLQLKQMNQILEKKVEERTAELKIALEKAEEMNRVKSYFFANMSHELRTPFVGILGFAELLHETVNSDDDKDMVDSIIRSAQRMQNTLTKILDLTNIEFLETKPELKTTDATKIIDRIFDEFSFAAAKKNLSFKKEFSQKPINLSTDVRLLTTLISNIVDNAIIYTEEGAVEISASVDKNNSKEVFILKVKDSGIGIPEEKRQLIWQEFRQASEGLSRRFEGTGLGLTIAKKNIDILGGKIDLQSEEGKGSTFTIMIPIEIGTKDNNKQNSHKDGAKEKHGVEMTREKSDKKILLVENDESNREVIQRFLSRFYIVETAEEANSAMEQLNKNVYDLILMDVNLGRGTDGVQLTEMIRKMPAYEKTPIVAVTAFASYNDEREFLERGMTHYIAKPFLMQNLLKMVDAAMEGVIN